MPWGAHGTANSSISPCEASFFSIAGFDTDLAEEFFRAVANSGKLTLHLWVRSGTNAHHMIEACFKAFARALRQRSGVHVHKHQHDGLAHAHVHFHEEETAHVESNGSHSHAIRRVGLKPLLVGAMHGLAGSAALTLLVLTQIESTALGLLYLAVFGLGSIVGMLLMSGLIALPFIFSVRKLAGIHYGLQAAAGVLSIAFGFWYAYETGIANGLF